VFPTTERLQALKGFQIQKRLGSGGAGEVYLALSKAGRPVAIKVLSDAKERDAAFSQELVREASLCVRLAHPAIVQVRALIEEEGFAAIVFDYIEGIALSRLMKLCAARGVRLPDNVAWHVVERVLSALSYAHKQKDEAHEPAPIVHRDVSPSNVLLAWSGDVKLADFGIAKMLGVSPATQYGLVKGTLGCMSPEQARGEPVDERADVYAAGLLAWRLATGREPYPTRDKDEMELLRAMRNPRIKPLSALRPDLPEPLAQAVERALAPNAADRTITAEQLAAVVRTSLEVEAGHVELEVLLGRWRASLEKKRARAEGASGAFESSVDSSGDHKNPTMRYDDIAQDDDEDIPFDRPTLQVQALPGDAASWAGRPTPMPLTLPRIVPSENRLPNATLQARPIAVPTPALPTIPILLPSPAAARAEGDGEGSQGDDTRRESSGESDRDRVSTANGPDSLARFRVEVGQNRAGNARVLVLAAVLVGLIAFAWWIGHHGP
jgi:serine/threonine protein kinase